MSKAAKAISKIQSKPTDFTWEELVSVMQSFGYEVKSNSGSSRKFIHPATKATLMMHKPHPGNIMKAYLIKATVAFLKQEKHI